MSGPRSGALYSTELLALAVELADVPFEPDAPLNGESRSRTCGSTVALSGRCDRNGGLTDIGLRVSACAVGQAAAAIFARAATGKRADEIEAARMAISAWLEGDGALPDWPRIAALEPALPHSGRHGAILLPWNAALAALSKEAGGG